MTGTRSRRTAWGLALVAGLALTPPAPSSAADAPARAAPAAPRRRASLDEEAAVVTRVEEGLVAAVSGGGEGDPAAVARLAALDVDPVWVAARLLSRHVALALAAPADAPPAPASVPLRAARAWADALRGSPRGMAADAWVASFATLARPDLERLDRLDRASDLARALRERGDLASLEALAVRSTADVEAARSKDGADLCFDLAVALAAQARLADAFAWAARSCETARRVPWPMGELRAASFVSSVAFEAGRAEEGLALATRAVEAVDAAGMSSRAAELRVGRAELLVSFGRYAEAYDEATSARALAAEDGALLLSVLATLAVGTAADGLGRRDEARRLFADAERLARSVARPEESARALLRIGREHMTADRLAAAASAYDAALSVAAPRSAVRAFALTLRGSVERRFGHDERAAELHREAVAIAEALGERRLATLARGNLANVLPALGRSDEAIELMRAVLAAKEASREAPESVADTRAALARTMRVAGRAQEGVPLLERAREEYRAGGNLVRAAAARSQLGLAQEALGRLDLAEAEQRGALAELAVLGDTSQTAGDVEGALGRVLLRQGRAAEAIEAGRRCVETYARLASGLGELDAEGLLPSVRSVADGGVEAAWAVARSDPRAAAEAAWTFVETSRAVLLAAGLSNAQALLAAEVAPATLSAEAARRSALGAARTALVRASARGDERAVAGARAAYDAAALAHREAVGRVEREARRLAGVAFPRPPASEAVRARLAPGDALVVYHATPTALYAVVWTRDGGSLLRLSDAAPTLADAEAWLALVATPGADDTALARRLFDVLVAPVDAAAGRPSRLLVSPDGPLAFLPFAALLESRDGRAERLVASRDVALVPSATVLEALAREAAVPRGRALVAVGDPDYGPAGGPALPPLPESAAEVREIAALFPADARTLLLGADATATAFVDAISRPKARLRAVHVAAHAFVDPDQPRRSALVLAGGAPVDLDDLYRLRTSADLVVLSACSTGRGASMKGEGVVGFARAFFLAGAPRVVTTSWVVSDESSRALMRRFYEGFEKGALGPAAALREAQRSLLAAGGAWAHPAHWAAFVLWGVPDDGERVATVPPRGRDGAAGDGAR